MIVYPAPNMIFEVLSNEGVDLDDPASHRVVWVSDDATHMVTVVLWIDELQTVTWDVAAWSRLVELNNIRIIPKDPYRSRLVKSTSKKTGERQQKAMALIEELFPKGTCNIYFPDLRAAEVSKYLARPKSSKIFSSQTTIYTYIRLYLQGGQTPNALRRDFDQIGNPGQPKPKTGKKLGRRYQEDAEGTGWGMNLTDEVCRSFDFGLRLFKGGHVQTKAAAYLKAMARFFKLGWDTDADGIRYAVLPHWKELPSKKQFYRYIKQIEDEASLALAREGLRAYALKYRPKHGDSTLQVRSPGALVQFDAQYADTSLTSLLLPGLVISGCHIYLGVDVMSHKIVSCVVVIRKPSWKALTVALEFTMVDKVEYCAELGIAIDPDDFPAFVPEAVTFDRGEGESKQATGLAEDFNIRVENTPPYRADLKGIVEKLYDWMNKELVKDLPGYKYPQERGRKNPKLYAALNIQEFRRLLIKAVIHYNRFQWIDDYPSDLFMVDADIEPNPQKLWEWGLKRRAGVLPEEDPDLVRLFLLPRAKASISGQGIHFKGRLYDCDDKRIQTKIRIAAKKKKRVPIKVTYNPYGRVNEVYCLVGESDIKQCKLRPRGRNVAMIQANAEMSEADLYGARLKAKRQEAEWAEQQDKVRLDADKDQTAKKAKKRTQEAIKDGSLKPADRLRNMRETTEADLEFDEAQSSAVTTKQPTTRLDDQQPLPSQPKFTYVPQPKNIDLIEQMLREEEADAEQA
jgi:putative transposase